MTTAHATIMSRPHTTEPAQIGYWNTLCERILSAGAEASEMIGVTRRLSGGKKTIVVTYDCLTPVATFTLQDGGVAFEIARTPPETGIMSFDRPEEIDAVAKRTFTV